MVSIRKYLDAYQRRGPSEADSGCGPLPGDSLLGDLCCALVDRLGACILAGDSESEPRAGLEDTKSLLYAEMGPAQAQRVENSIRTVLSAWAVREAEHAQRTALETQNIVGVLNHALMVLAGGGNRSVSRLHRIQEALNRASAIRDTQGLRASLADAMKLIREESVQEQESSSQEIAGLESEVIRFRERLAADPSRRMPGRDGAVQGLADRLRNLAPGSSLYVAAFVFDDLKAIVQRYGSEPADELFFEVIRERVQPLSAVNTSWRWSQGCAVAFFEHSSALAVLQSQMAKLCARPLVYRMTLGNRTAILKVAVSHFLAVAAAESLPALISQIDRFSGSEARNG
jgi:hypothetical protein